MGAALIWNLGLQLEFQQEGSGTLRAFLGIDGLEAKRKGFDNKALIGTLASTEGCCIDRTWGLRGMELGDGKLFAGEEKPSASLVILAAFAKYECKSQGMVSQAK